MTNEVLAGFESGGDLEGINALIGCEDVGRSPFAIDETLFVNLEPDSATIE